MTNKTVSTTLLHFAKKEILRVPKANSYSFICTLLFVLATIAPCKGQDQTHSPKNNEGEPSTTPPKQSVNMEGAKEAITYGAGDIVTSGLLDRTGNLWFGTTTEGVYRYDGKSFANFTEREGLCSNEVWSMLEDTDGIIWFGTADGLCSYDGKTFTHVPLPWDGENDLWGKLCNPNQVTSMLQDKNGFYWLGTCGGGAYRYDGKTFISFLSATGQIQSDGLHHNVVKSMLEDTAGNIWFTSLTHGGVSRYDGESLTHFTAKDGLNDDMVFASILDHTGNIWFGCIQSKGGGLYRYDGKSFTNFTKEDGLCDNFVMSFFEDRTNKLWIGTGSGICIYDPSGSHSPEGKVFTPFLPADEDLALGDIRFFVEDKANNVWFGGRYGVLYRYDGKTITEFTHKGH